MNVFVTGGCGFIGSNFVRYLLGHKKNFRVVNLDALTYAGNRANLADVEADFAGRYRFVRGDIADAELVTKILREEEIEWVVHFAAESHVDRSILGAGDFVRTNVLGTQTLLDAARAAGTNRFVQISTDEVYGSLGPRGKFHEKLPLAPNSAYSASKAAADLLCRAAHHTFGQDIVVTRCSNNYGPYQFPEKLIPLMITHALENKPLPVYGDGKNVRDWIHVEDHCAAIWTVAQKGKSGEVYNIGGDNERTNLEIVRAILDFLGKPRSLIRFVPDRPGHDRRYAMDTRKIRRELGWRPRVAFARGLAATIEWYCQNRAWWQHIKSGAYQKYYRMQYGRGSPLRASKSQL